MDDETDNNPQPWLGTSLEDMYRGQGPWHFASTPVNASKYHHVLFQLPATRRDVPQAHYNSKQKHWDDDFVRMPYSPHSLFLVKQGGEEVIKPRWDVICEALSKPINTVEELEKAIGCYNNKLPKFRGLQRFFNDVLEEEEAQYFFKNILPKIIQLALRLPELVPGNIPLLRKNHCKSVSLSQMQVASLLANAFLCTLIWRTDMAETFPAAVRRLFMYDRGNYVAEKLKCIIHYFNRVTSKNPLGVITFERKFVPRGSMPRWDLLENNLGNTKIHITSSGTIEDGHGLLQVDFANKFIGGGVLGHGCVQEEIRFVICPELIISRLFTEVLGDSEAVVVTGVEQYSTYSGYAESFKWVTNFKDETPFDDYGRRKTTVAVIDAIHFLKSKDQFHCSTILRELNKAYVGFSAREKTNLAPVATGNWGCGAFRGDPKLKSLIQLMACSAANRDLVYYSFGDTELRDDFYNMHSFLANNQVTICQLWRYLCRFCAANLTQEKLYSFVQQCHFDMKSQPTLKQFLCCNTQKKKIDKPSTSGAEKAEEPEEKPSSSKTQSEKRPPVDKHQSEKKQQIDPQEIIDIIDGNGRKPSESTSEVSTLLSEIDKLKKCPVLQESTEIAMEVDEREEVVAKPGSFVDHKKRRITDYFSKMTNHVNSYL